MISATLSDNDLFYLRLEIPGVIDGAPVPAGAFVTAEFSPQDDGRGGLVFDLGDGRVIEPMYETVPMAGQTTHEVFDFAHLLERLDFAQHSHPQPHRASLRLEKDDDDERWFLIPVAEGTDLETVVVYPASMSDTRVTVTEWRSFESTGGWIPEGVSSVVFQFANWLAEPLAAIPAGERVTIVIGAADAAQLITSEVGAPLIGRTTGEPTQAQFAVDELRRALTLLRDRFEGGSAQLALYANDREWVMTARWAEHIEYETVRPG